MLRLPRRGFGGGIKFGVIPPFDNGIYGGMAGILLNLSPNGDGRLFKSNDGILLMLLGLFYASNLYAKVPCF